MIAPHILALSAFFTIVFGWHLLDAREDWRDARRAVPVATDPALRAAELVRLRRELGEAFRNLLAALCLVDISVSYLVRTAIVIAGFGDGVAGQVVFFSLIGICIPAALFMVVSRRVR